MVEKLKYVVPGDRGDRGEDEFKDQPRLINCVLLNMFQLGSINDLSSSVAISTLILCADVIFLNALWITELL